MAKRFVDTDLWQKAWFWKLKSKHQWFVMYLFQNCDNAGVWHVNYLMPNAIHGESTFSDDDIIEINNTHKLFEFLENDKIFIIDFIQFQYGTLSENCKPHKPIIEKLKKYNLFEKVLKGYSKGIETLEEQEQVQEKDKEKEKEIECYGSNLNVVLVKGDYEKLLAVTQSKELLNEVIEDLGTAIRIGKENEYKSNLPYAHYERLRAFIKYRREHPTIAKGSTPLERKYNAIQACFNGGKNG